LKYTRQADGYNLKSPCVVTDNATNSYAIYHPVVAGTTDHTPRSN